ncbi:hypothetical protein MC885_020659, partial [Smutsia gigantea]
MQSLIRGWCRTQSRDTVSVVVVTATAVQALGSLLPALLLGLADLVAITCHVQRFHPQSVHLTSLENCHMFNVAEPPTPKKNLDGSYTRESSQGSKSVLTRKVQQEAQPPIQANLILSPSAHSTYKPTGSTGTAGDEFHSHLHPQMAEPITGYKSLKALMGPGSLRWSKEVPGIDILGPSNASSCPLISRPRATYSAPGGSPPRPQGAADSRGLCRLCAQDEEGLTLLPAPPAAHCPPCLLPPFCPEGPSQRQGAARSFHKFSSQCHPPGRPASLSSCSFSETPVFPGLGPHTCSSQKHMHTESEVTSSSSSHTQDFSVMGGESEDKEGTVPLVHSDPLPIVMDVGARGRESSAVTTAVVLGSASSPQNCGF